MRYIWHVAINFAVINVPRFVKLYYTVLEQEAPCRSVPLRAAPRRAAPRARAKDELVALRMWGTQKSDGRDAALLQGPLMARSSRPRRRMEIIDESQSACLRATNTYLSEAPCNHNKTAAALPRTVYERAQFLTTNLFRFNCYVPTCAITGKQSSLGFNTAAGQQLSR